MKRKDDENRQQIKETMAKETANKVKLVATAAKKKIQEEESADALDTQAAKIAAIKKATAPSKERGAPQCHLLQHQDHRS